MFNQKKGRKISTYFNHTDIGRSRDTTPLGKRERERVNIFISSKTCVVHNVEVHIVQVHIVEVHIMKVHIVHID